MVMEQRLTRTERGVSKITLLVFGLLIAGVVYSSYRIMPFYYYYYEIQNQMDALTRVASTHTDQEIRKKLIYHIKKYQLPVSPEEIVIVRDGGKIEMSLEYDEVFYITLGNKDYDIHTFHFHAYAEGDVPL